MPGLSSPSRLGRAVFMRGIVGGSPRWLAVGAALWGVKGLRMAFRRQHAVVWRGRLAEGETIVLSARSGRRR
jgi:hypothetical protein